MDVIKIAATGGVLSLAKSGDAPLFTDEELKAVVETRSHRTIATEDRRSAKPIASLQSIDA